MKKGHWRPPPTTNTTLVLLRKGRRVVHVVVGSALLDADWGAELSMLMPENEVPGLLELFSDTPQQARRAFKELCDLGDFDPDPDDFRQVWLPPAAGLATMNWLLFEAAQPRSKAGRLLGPDARREAQLIRLVLTEAEKQGLDFHLVEVRRRESRSFAGREMVVRPENNAELTKSRASGQAGLCSSTQVRRA